MEHTRTYLEIQKVRYQDKISYSIELDKDLNEICVQRLIIQPLVENAIYHGLKPKKKDGKIHIDSSREENDLIIKVQDDGFGMTGDKLIRLTGIWESPLNQSTTAYTTLTSV